MPGFHAMLGVPLALLLVAARAPGAFGHSHTPGGETSGLSWMLREVFAGSKARNFIHRWFMKHIPEARVGSAVSAVTANADGTFEQTFLGPPMHLQNGQIGNKWMPIDWPRGHIAVKAFTADVVKAGPGGEVPPPEPCCGGAHEASRQEVFMHHWTVNKWQLPTSYYEKIVAEGGMNYKLNWQKEGKTQLWAGAGLNAGANGPCWDANLHLFFGIGNEARGRPLAGGDSFAFPDPYGVEFDSELMRRVGEFMVLNTHLIDIRNATDRRACEECKCSELGVTPREPRAIGGLTCCHSTDSDGGKCRVDTPEAEKVRQTYFVRYTIKWRSFDTATTKPLEVITFDATDNNTKWGDLASVPGGFHEKHLALKSDPFSQATIADARSGDFDGYRGCHVEYFVPPCAAGDPCVHKVQNSWEMPYPIEIVYIRNHFHSGGISMSTRTSKMNCTGNATYAEDGGLRDISTCRLGGAELSEQTFRVERGEQVTVHTLYKQDQLPHYGVMAMSFVYGYVPRARGSGSWYV